MSFFGLGAQGAPAPPPPPPNLSAGVTGASAMRAAAAVANGKGFNNTIKTSQAGAAKPATTAPQLFGA